MPVKDRIVTWYIQNILIPRTEIIDKPGFVVTTFTKPPDTTYLRELFLPEKLFELIETKIVKNYGDKGKQVLYSAGKKFGYVYASISNFPTITTTNKKEFSDFAYYLMRYIEGVFSAKAQHEINLEEKLFIVIFNQYIVCRKNGLGYIMSDGGIAGIWSFAIEDKSIEGIQVECQGRGDKRCYIVCEPEEKIKKRMTDYFSETNLIEQQFDEMYKLLNEIRPTSYSNNSLKDLLNAGFFEYKHGSLTYKNIRFFPVEAHLLYFLENEISKLENGEQILFDICFEFGKYLRETYGFKDYNKFIPDFFSALGFGDLIFIDVNKPTLGTIFYPWTSYSEKSKYIIFRGIMSGIVSDSLGKKIAFDEFKIDVGDCLTLTITQRQLLINNEETASKAS